MFGHGVNIRLKMQKRPSISETKEDICDIQNDLVVQKLFEDAIEVLRLAGADEKATGKPAIYVDIKMLLLLTVHHLFVLILIMRSCWYIKTMSSC